jgi:hypothetical protein
VVETPVGHVYVKFQTFFAYSIIGAFKISVGVLGTPAVPAMAFFYQCPDEQLAQIRLFHEYPSIGGSHFHHAIGRVVRVRSLGGIGSVILPFDSIYRVTNQLHRFRDWVPEKCKG